MALESPPWAPVWRYALYDDYKYAVTRVDRPKVARSLQRPVIAAAEELGYPTVFSPGFEADDVIATMVDKLDLDTLDVYIWSQDKDLHQLLTHPNVRMLGKGGQQTTMAQVEEEWGWPGEAIPLIKALSGDPSDNILGVKGIGPKTAAKMIVSRPFRKQSPFWLDLDNMSGKKKADVIRLIPRISKDEHLCILRRDAELYPGSEYMEATTEH